jgi:hypothetical protein
MEALMSEVRNIDDAAMAKLLALVATLPKSRLQQLQSYIRGLLQAAQH